MIVLRPATTAAMRLACARVSVTPPTSATRLFATRFVSTVPLAYDLHEPAKPVADNKTNPIIIMHGLFGSKKNNRTISK